MMDPVDLRIRRLRPQATLPAYQSAHAAGLDLHACIDAPVTIAPGAIALVPCGFAMAIPPGWEAQVRPRSGLATRHGIGMPNAPGTIDAAFRGEIKVNLINHDPATPVTFKRGDRIAQLVVQPVSRAVFVPVADLPGTERGDGGFGSTG